MTRLVLAWVATALAATAAAVAVLGLLGGSSLTGSEGRVLDSDEVRAALASASMSATAPGSTAPSVSAVPSSAVPTPVVPEFVVLTTAGGTVVASCSGGQVTLRSWSPAQGYSIDEADPGPAATAKVEFEPEEGEELEARVGCSGDRPILLPS